MRIWQRRAYRLRWAILIAGLLCWAAALFWVFNPVWPGMQVPLITDEPAGLMGVLGWAFPWESGATWYVAYASTVVGALLVSQWLFLAPRRWFRIELTAEAKPVWHSIVSAALMAALLTAAFLAVLVELPDWWMAVAWDESKPLDDPDFAPVWPGVLLVCIPWIVWTVLFAVYWRDGDCYTQLSRLVRGLVAGSVLELLVAIPAHVWVMRQRDCYCMRGTYTGIVLGVAVLLWAFGPGVVLLFLRERYRRQKLLPECPNCGYDLRGTTAPGRSECPECGAAIVMPSAAEQ